MRLFTAAVCVLLTSVHTADGQESAVAPTTVADQAVGAAQPDAGPTEPASAPEPVSPGEDASAAAEAEAPDAGPADPQEDALAEEQAASRQDPASQGDAASQKDTAEEDTVEPEPADSQEGGAKGDAAESEDAAAEDTLEDEAPEADEAAATEGADWAGLVERAPAFLALTHHAAVHLPIALWLFGAFFVVIGVVAPSLRNQIPLACLVGGAVTSVAATASGWWYADYEWGEPWDWSVGVGDIDWSEQLTQHRWTGVALVAASCVLSVLAIISVNRTRGWKLAWFWRLGLIALAAAVAWEGHVGGELIHGEGFLEEAFVEWVTPEAE